eukprot:TRINITY_DN6508_c0_g1_i15.p1 TRINITY_DN6508_c0_g1~~TRINITY_DN6508_c0_g1_i15.p1  ORF type:complete len:484 (+),score=102.15 TRINITY_DN6508_c0_g1_i15:797-2248(+)
MKVGNFGEPTSYSTPSLFTTTSSSALSNSSNDNNSNATTNDVGLSLSFLNITKKKDTLTWMETMAWDAKNANIFSERNDNDDISWEPHVTEDETAWRLSGATFTALLDFITNNLSSKALVNTILVTHEHFTTPDELMRQFVVNFNKATADGNKDKQTSIVYALKQWWKHNLEVFQEGSKVVEELQTFFDFLSQDPEKNDFCSWHRMLVGWWKGALEEAEDDFNSKQMHRILKQSIVCIRNKQSLLEFLPEDVAQQLTLRDHYYFRLLPPRELVKKRYDKATESPNLNEMSKHFNWITSWVVSEVLAPNLTPKHRAKTISFIIKVARELFDLHNYSGLMAIVLGLSDSSVTRLTKTWKPISTIEYQQWKEMEEIMQPLGNFKSLRAIMATVAAPLVPLSGMLVKDLIMIEEGNEDCWKGKKDHMNVEKLLMFGNVIARIQFSQQVFYRFNILEEIHAYFPTVQLIPVKERSEISRKIEPPDVIH